MSEHEPSDSSDPSNPAAVLAHQIVSHAFVDVCELDLSGRGLNALPEAIGHLSQLTKLNCANNPLSSLPASFAQLRELRTLFFLGCHFTDIPEVVGRLPTLFMLSFKSNRLTTIAESALPSSLGWLILTDNALTSLPASLGRLAHLRKLMLASNRLTVLPDLRALEQIELVRLSDNALPWDTVVASGLLRLPRLAWLALAGNATDRTEDGAVDALCVLPPHQFHLGQPVGEGASGTVYKGGWTRQVETATTAVSVQPVAIKVFKSASSDGRPIDELRACLSLVPAPGASPSQPAASASSTVAAASSPSAVHAHIINALGQVRPPDGGMWLIMELLRPEWVMLARPPSFASVTRDTYPAPYQWPLRTAVAIGLAVARAVAFVHGQGVMHGDVYGHNIAFAPNLSADPGYIDGVDPFPCKLGDFGAAWRFDVASPHVADLAAIEVRALGVLLAELAVYVTSPPETSAPLHELAAQCMNLVPSQRPSLTTLVQLLEQLMSMTP